MQRGVPNRSLANATSYASINNILDSAENVNRKEQKTETPTSALGGTAVREQRFLISSESPVISIAGFLEHVKTIPIANVFSRKMWYR